MLERDHQGFLRCTFSGVEDIDTSQSEQKIRQIGISHFSIHQHNFLLEYFGSKAEVMKGITLDQSLPFYVTGNPLKDSAGVTV